MARHDFERVTLYRLVASRLCVSIWTWNKSLAREEADALINKRGEDCAVAHLAAGCAALRTLREEKKREEKEEDERNLLGFVYAAVFVAQEEDMSRCVYITCAAWKPSPHRLSTGNISTNASL